MSCFLKSDLVYHTRFFLCFGCRSLRWFFPYFRLVSHAACCLGILCVLVFLTGAHSYHGKTSVFSNCICCSTKMELLVLFWLVFEGYFPPNLFRVSISQWGSACGKSSDKILEKHPWGYSYFECQLEI